MHKNVPTYQALNYTFQFQLKNIFPSNISGNITVSKSHFQIFMTLITLIKLS